MEHAVQEGKNGERGATLVEAAISYGLLMLALFALVEFGLAFKDFLSVSNATREGVRAGAALGNDRHADILILRKVEESLGPVGLVSGSQVRVFNAVAPDVGTSYVYQPGTGCGSVGTLSLGGCCDWSPCPEPGRSSYVTPAWNPHIRDISAPVTDRLAVQITLTHQWLTGFFGATTDFTATSRLQIEPQVFDS